MGVFLFSAHPVQIEQALVQTHLQVQGTFHGSQATVPVVEVRPADVMQTEVASALVLQPHQLLDEFPLLT